MVKKKVERRPAVRVESPFSGRNEFARITDSSNRIPAAPLSHQKSQAGVTRLTAPPIHAASRKCFVSTASELVGAANRHGNDDDEDDAVGNAHIQVTRRAVPAPICSSSSSSSKTSTSSATGVPLKSAPAEYPSYASHDRRGKASYFFTSPLNSPLIAPSSAPLFDPLSETASELPSSSRQPTRPNSDRNQQKETRNVRERGGGAPTMKKVSQKNDTRNPQRSSGNPIKGKGVGGADGPSVKRPSSTAFYSQNSPPHLYEKNQPAPHEEEALRSAPYGLNETLSDSHEKCKSERNASASTVSLSNAELGTRTGDGAEENTQHAGRQDEIETQEDRRESLSDEGPPSAEEQAKLAGDLFLTRLRGSADEQYKRSFRTLVGSDRSGAHLFGPTWAVAISDLNMNAVGADDGRLSSSVSSMLDDGSRNSMEMVRMQRAAALQRLVKLHSRVYDPTAHEDDDDVDDDVCRREGCPNSTWTSNRIFATVVSPLKEQQRIRYGTRNASERATEIHDLALLESTKSVGVWRYEQRVQAKSMPVATPPLPFRIQL